MVKLADTMDLGSIPATGRGSSPLGRTSSGIPLTAALPAPKGRKAPPDGEFLRLQLRTAALGPQLIFFAGDERRGTGDEGRGTGDEGRGTGDGKKGLRFGKNVVCWYL